MKHKIISLVGLLALCGYSWSVSASNSYIKDCNYCYSESSYRESATAVAQQTPVFQAENTRIYIFNINRLEFRVYRPVWVTDSGGFVSISDIASVEPSFAEPGVQDKINSMFDAYTDYLFAVDQMKSVSSGSIDGLDGIGVNSAFDLVNNGSWRVNSFETAVQGWANNSLGGILVNLRYTLGQLATSNVLSIQLNLEVGMVIRVVFPDGTMVDLDIKGMTIDANSWDNPELGLEIDMGSIRAQGSVLTIDPSGDAPEGVHLFQNSEQALNFLMMSGRTWQCETESMNCDDNNGRCTVTLHAC